MFYALRFQHYKRRFDALKEELAQAHNDPSLRSLWHQYHYYGKKLYMMRRKNWLRIIKRDLKNMHAYSAFYWLPQILIDLVQHCYDYWHDGYNVWAEEEWTAPIRKQTEHAMDLIGECEIYAAETGEFPAEKIAELFTFVGQNIDNWCD